jgi:hypothetical protein
MKIIEGSRYRQKYFEKYVTVVKISKQQVWFIDEYARFKYNKEKFLRDFIEVKNENHQAIIRNHDRHRWK